VDEFDLLELIFRREVVEALEAKVLARHSPGDTPEGEFQSWLYLNCSRLSALMHYQARERQGGMIVANKEDYMMATNLLRNLIPVMKRGLLL
jgi:hypothetical protein